MGINNYNDYNYEVLDPNTECKQVVNRSHLRVTHEWIRHSEEEYSDKRESEERTSKIDEKGTASESDSEDDVLNYIVNELKPMLKA